MTFKNLLLEEEGLILAPLKKTEYELGMDAQKKKTPYSEEDMIDFTNWVNSKQFSKKWIKYSEGIWGWYSGFENKFLANSTKELLELYLKTKSVQ